MAVRLINGKKYDFHEMNLEESLEIEEMIPAFYSAFEKGQPMPKGSIMQVAKKVFAFCMVDGKDMGDPNDYFASTKMRAEFHLALMEGLKVNFADLFTQLLGSFASGTKASGLAEKLSGLATSSQATQGE